MVHATSGEHPADLLGIDFLSSPTGGAPGAAAKSAVAQSSPADAPSTAAASQLLLFPEPQPQQQPQQQPAKCAPGLVSGGEVQHEQENCPPLDQPAAPQTAEQPAQQRQPSLLLQQQDQIEVPPLPPQQQLRFSTDAGGDTLDLQPSEALDLRLPSEPLINAPFLFAEQPQAAFFPPLQQQQQQLEGLQQQQQQIEGLQQPLELLPLQQQTQPTQLQQQQQHHHAPSSSGEPLVACPSPTAAASAGAASDLDRTSGDTGAASGIHPAAQQDQQQVFVGVTQAGTPTAAASVPLSAAKLQDLQQRVTRREGDHRLLALADLIPERLVNAACAGDVSAMDALQILASELGGGAHGVPGIGGESDSDDGDWGVDGTGGDGTDDDLSDDLDLTARRPCVNCTHANPEVLPQCEECGHVLDHDASIFALTLPPAEPAVAADAATAGVGAAAEVASTSSDALPAVLCFDERMTAHEEGRRAPHPERPDRIRAVMARLSRQGLLDRVQRVACREATKEELETCHTPELVTGLEAASRQANEAINGQPAYYTPDTYINGHTYQCARLSAGGCVEVTTAVVRREARCGVAVVRPPGHHAESNTAMGFCFFNNAAIAARAAQAAGARRVLILDWDVHHGNGTQHIFEEDDSVMYMSLHRYDGGSFYPGTGAAGEVGRGVGEGYTVNVPWLCGNMHDGDYLAAFNHVLLPIAYEFNPDLLIVSAGFDAALGDPIGGCEVSPQGFAHMTSLLKGVAPMVVLLEGGYNLTATAASVESVLRVMLGETPPALPGRRAPSTQGMAAIKQAIAAQAEHWTCMSLMHNMAAPDSLELAELRAEALAAAGMMEDDEGEGESDGATTPSTTDMEEDELAPPQQQQQAAEAAAAELAAAAAAAAATPAVEPPRRRPQRAAAAAAASLMEAELAKERAAAAGPGVPAGDAAVAAAAEGAGPLAVNVTADANGPANGHRDGEVSSSSDAAHGSESDNEADSADSREQGSGGEGGAVASSPGKAAAAGLQRKRSLSATSSVDALLAGLSADQVNLLRACKRQKQFTTERKWQLINALHISALRGLLRRQAARKKGGMGGTPTKPTKADSI